MPLNSLPPGTEVRLFSDQLMLVDENGTPLPDDIQKQFFDEYPPTSIEILRSEIERLQKKH